MTTEQTEIGTEVASVGEVSPARQGASTADEPMSLVRMALEKGLDPESLKKLVDLQTQITDRNARMGYFDALATFQETVPHIQKSKTVNYAAGNGARVQYNYAPLEEITRTIRPVLKANGLSYSWDVESTDGGVMVVAAVLRHVDGHEERSTFPVPVDTRAKMSAAQAHGAALTYGKRQALVAVLGLTTTDDDVDGRTPVEPPETITAEQEVALSDIAEEAGVNVDAFCQWLGVPSIAEIPAGRFGEAKAALDRKLAAKNGGAS